jgi:hypothetical protein
MRNAAIYRLKAVFLIGNDNLSKLNIFKYYNLKNRMFSNLFASSLFVDDYRILSFKSYKNLVKAMAGFRLFVR